MTNQVRNSLFASTSAFAQVPALKPPLQDEKKIEQKIAQAELDIEGMYYKLTTASHLVKNNTQALELINEVADELYRSFR